MQNHNKTASMASPQSVERRGRHDRRQHSLRTLAYCGLQKRGRRKQIRRSGENYYIDWYDPRLVTLSIAILLLSSLDAALTLTLLDRGAYEANLFMAKMLEINERVFVFSKVLITSLGVLFLLMHAHFRILRVATGKHALQVLLIVYALLISYEVFLLWRFG